MAEKARKKQKVVVFIDWIISILLTLLVQLRNKILKYFIIPCLNVKDLALFLFSSFSFSHIKQVMAEKTRKKQKVVVFVDLSISGILALLSSDILNYLIIPCLNVKDLALFRPTCRWCNKQWQEFLKRNTFRVPEQVRTIEEAMIVGFNLAKQKVYSKDKPLMVVLSEGEHVVKGCTNSGVNTLEFLCSNISFVGQGEDKTIVNGGIHVKKRKNVMLGSLTLTNPNQNKYGLLVEGSEASVEIIEVSIEKFPIGIQVTFDASVKATKCGIHENTDCGIIVGYGSKGIFTDCTISHNVEYSVLASGEGTLVELRGEQTEIHYKGLSACFDATIKIYIPSQSITPLVYDDGKNDFNTGQIYSQLSSSSLVMTVICAPATPFPWVAALYD